jgi:hypothetical protein
MSYYTTGDAATDREMNEAAKARWDAWERYAQEGANARAAGIKRCPYDLRAGGEEARAALAWLGGLPEIEG